MKAEGSWAPGTWRPGCGKEATASLRGYACSRRSASSVFEARVVARL
jgi:hypothetical protein